MTIFERNRTNITRRSLDVIAWESSQFALSPAAFVAVVKSGLVIKLEWKGEWNVRFSREDVK
jgi:hypothetical protein